MFVSAWSNQYAASNWLIFAGFCLGVVPVGATPTSLRVLPIKGVVASPTSPPPTNFSAHSGSIFSFSAMAK